MSFPAEYHKPKKTRATKLNHARPGTAADVPKSPETAALNPESAETGVATTAAKVLPAATVEAVDVNTATKTPIANGIDVKKFEKTLKEVYEQCQSRILYFEGLIEELMLADKNKLQTFLKLKFAVTKNNRILKDIDLMKTTIRDSLIFYTKCYKVICKRIKAGITLDELMDIFFILKATSLLHAFDAKKSNNIKFAQERFFIGPLLDKIRPFLSEIQREMEGYIYHESKNMYFNLPFLSKVYSETQFKTNDLIRKILTDFEIQVEKKISAKLILPLVDLTTKLSKAYHAQLKHVLKKITQKIGNFEQQCNKIESEQKLMHLFKELKLLILDLKEDIVPSQAIHQKLVFYRYTQKKFGNLCEKIYSEWDNTAEELKKAIEKFRSSFLNNSTLVNPDINIIELGLSISLKWLHFFKDNSFLDSFTEDFQLKGDEISVNKQIQDKIEELEATHNLLQKARKDINDNFELLFENAKSTLPKPEPATASASIDAANASTTTNNAEIERKLKNKATHANPVPILEPPTLEDWKKQINERKGLLIKEREARRRAEVELELQKQRAKREQSEKKFAMEAVDLKSREEKIRAALKINPTIKELFQKLYYPENKFSHEDVESIITALRTQGFTIDLQYRDSHYTLLIEGSYGDYDEEEFTVKSKALKVHNRDNKTFSKRTMSGLQNLFTRAGFTEALILGTTQASTPASASASVDLLAAGGVMRTATTAAAATEASAVATTRTAASATTEATAVAASATDNALAREGSRREVSLTTQYAMHRRTSPTAGSCDRTESTIGAKASKKPD